METREIHQFSLTRKKKMVKKTVCIQGLGYVGAAMAVAIANAVNPNNESIFDVLGVELDTPQGQERVSKINQGIFPFPTSDEKLKNKIREFHIKKNLTATVDASVFKNADIILVAIPLDIDSLNKQDKKFVLDPFKQAIRTFAKIMPESCLVIIETTVPPGTCRHIVYPILKEEFQKRHIDTNKILLAHSYERVMPGSEYLDSIINFYRCYAGYNQKSANSCHDFYVKIINTKLWPITRFEKLESSEIAKVLENSYRATTIAFMEEWAELAEDLQVNLYEVIDAIRMRPTHSNMRQPGFGVGGYCLTKDPLFAMLSCHHILDKKELSFPFCELAVNVNQNMPLRCLKKLKLQLGSLKSKNILLLGISYKQEVGDTRYSPAAIFYDEAIKDDCNIICHDPLVEFWEEKNMFIETNLHLINSEKIDAVVIATPHLEYKTFDFSGWLKNQVTVIFDACAILSDELMEKLKMKGYPVFVIGRGKME